MYASFEIIFTNIAASMDDLFIGATSFIVLRVLSSWLYWCMHSYFRLSAYISEVVNFILWLVLSVFIINHLFGSEVSTSLFQGFSIGMGYAFQPYIVSMFTGLCNGFMIKKGDIILYNNKEVVVSKLTLFYVTVKSGDFISYIPHRVFSSSPLHVKSKLVSK